jgi:hypothetical protein
MMTLQRRALIVHAALAVLFVWPPCHHVLVRTLDVNAWKFGGWAMYAVLGPTARVSIAAELDGRSVTIDASVAPPAVRRAAARYHALTRQYGLLVEPAVLGRAVLANEQRLDKVVVLRRSLYLDPGTDRIAERVTRYEYVR